MSDSVRPHRRHSTGLPHPWDSPGKNTGMGCHFLLQCMKVKRESEVAQSCSTLSDPMDYSLPGSSVHGIFQARVLEWSAIAFSGTSYLSLPNFSSLQSLKQLIYFLFLWIFLFWKFHINGIIQYVTFCDWFLSLNIMFTRFIYVAAYVQFSSVQSLNHVDSATPWMAAHKASCPSPTSGACSNSCPLSR